MDGTIIQQHWTLQLSVI